MACRLKKRISSVRRKLHVLELVNKFKSVKRNSITLSAALQHMYKLRRLLESVRREYVDLTTARREYINLLKLVKNVKVEQLVGGSGFAIRVTCEKEEDKLVSVLEAFDNMGLNVLQANVSCNDVLSLEAIVDAKNQTLGAKEITQGIIYAITSSKCHSA